MTKDQHTHHEPTATTTIPPETTSAKSDETLGVVSMILGIISLMGPGLLLGVPAIILSSISLKKGQGGRGMSITGLITGVISTIVSLILLGFFAMAFIWALNNPQTWDEQYWKELQKSAPSEQRLQQDLFENLKT